MDNIIRIERNTKIIRQYDPNIINFHLELIDTLSVKFVKNYGAVLLFEEDLIDTEDTSRFVHMNGSKPIGICIGCDDNYIYISKLETIHSKELFDNNKIEDLVAVMRYIGYIDENDISIVNKIISFDIVTKERKKLINLQKKT